MKVAVIGYGSRYRMGYLHLTQAIDAGMKPVAVADLREESRAAAERDFPGIETYPSADEMLKKTDADVVIIITQNATHAELALKCLRAGKHVVCEKPFDVTTAKCDKVINEARKRKLMVAVYHNRHWDGSIIKAVRDVNGKGVIGDVYRVEAALQVYADPTDYWGTRWRSSKSLTGGILFDWGVHIVEWIFQLMGDGICHVEGFVHKGFWKTPWKEDTIEDDALMIIRYEDGRCATLRVSYIEAAERMPSPVVKIRGTKGVYVMECDRYRLVTPRGDTLIHKEGKNPPSRWGLLYKNVAAHLRRGVPLVVTPEYARNLVHVLELAGKSAEVGKPIAPKFR